VSGSGERGFSLVEVMIVMMLGLFIIAAVAGVYVSSARSASFTDGLLGLQENGRFGVSTLQRGLRMAGYSAGYRLEAIDMSASGPDTIAVRLRQSHDCNGVSTGADGIALNVYAHDAVMRTITCTDDGPGATPMPIVEQVDGLRVLYGIDSDGDGVPERYVPHAPTLDSAQVSSLRFALLIDSGTPIRDRIESTSHVLLDRLVEREDRLLRAVFTGTVALRNRH